jgi:hypothetical protein
MQNIMFRRLRGFLAESRERRAEGGERRAESKGQRAKGRVLRAERYFSPHF